MITNEGRFTRPARPFAKTFNQPPQPERPHVPDIIHCRQVVEMDRKQFILTRRQNHGGQFLRIEELRNGSRNLVIVPAEHAEAFLAALKFTMENTTEKPAATAAA